MKLVNTEPIAALGTDRRESRWYWESDGEPHARTFYVVHTFKHERHDCASKKEAKTLADKLNSQ